MMRAVFFCCIRKMVAIHLGDQEGEPPLNEGYET